MPTYRVYPLDFDGNIIGPGQRAKWDTDRDARVFALMVQAAGGSFEIWRDTTKIFPLTGAQTKANGIGNACEAIYELRD